MRTMDVPRAVTRTPATTAPATTVGLCQQLLLLLSVLWTTQTSDDVKYVLPTPNHILCHQNQNLRTLVYLGNIILIRHIQCPTISVEMVRRVKFFHQWTANFISFSAVYWVLSLLFEIISVSSQKESYGLVFRGPENVEVFGYSGNCWASRASLGTWVTGSWKCSQWI